MSKNKNYEIWPRNWKGKKKKLFENLNPWVVLGRNLFFFLCVASFTWNWMKLAVLFSVFLAQKWNWLWFHGWNWLKLWNRQDSVGKKLKLTARGFFVAVSANFFPTESGRFHNFSKFHPSNHSQFHFWAKKTENKTASFIQFHVKLATHTKKRGFYLKPL